MNQIKEYANRKFLGLKGLYWLGILVLALAIYAYMAKDKIEPIDEVSDTEADNIETTDEVSDTATVPFVSPYSALTSSGGTVYVQNPAQSGVPLANTEISTNVEWARRGVAHLATQGVPGTQAQAAIQTYLTGGALSAQQTKWMDALVKELGVPPYADEIASATSEVSPIDPKSQARTFVGYVKRGGSSAIYSLYSNNTLWHISPTEMSALIQADPKLEIKALPVGDVVWTYPAFAPNGVRYTELPS